MRLSSPVTALKGVGGKTAEKFAAAGIVTIEDLLAWYPRDYMQYERPVERPDELTDGRFAAVCGFMARSPVVRYAGRYKITTATVAQGQAQVRLVWFNMPYLRSSLQPNRRYVFYGRVKVSGRSISLQQPRVFDPAEYEQLTKSLQSVYRLSGGLGAGLIKRTVAQALSQVDEADRADPLPACYKERYGLADYWQALQWIHMPDTMEHFRQGRSRIAFDEFFYFIMGIRRYRELHEGTVRGYALADVRQTDMLTASLPYSLTDAQKRVWDEVRADMKRSVVMGRLIQGDVGSGKTIIAFLALVMAAGNGGQGALMAPTEVLARQHFAALTKLLHAAGVEMEAVLLTGSMGAAARREAFEAIADGRAQIIVGTHALIQEKVAYHRLMLCVVDEQHRFGVRQREALQAKGMSPHILIMSATPIPRTLAAMLYADLQVSVIDQMPAGRLPIRNCVVDPSYREKAYAFIARQVALGHRAYVICPMIEESEEQDLASVESYALTLQENLPADVQVGFLHGRMHAAEKNARMEAFVKGGIQVLVSTTVIEVGVNVPEATVMMIEDAQRFGLAQLHQLRGRVGRGSDQAYCIMIDTSGRGEADPRLAVMNSSNDGFEIARKDLEMRGPGDLLGIRQSGELGFTVADVLGDSRVLQYASETADDILRQDAQLSLPVHALLCDKLNNYLAHSPQNLSV